MRDILLFFLTGPLMIVSLMRPFVGLIAYFAYSFIGPHSYTYGFARSFPHVQAIAICTLIGYFFSQERKQFPKEKEFWLLIVLWVVFVISTGFAFLPDRAVEHLLKMSKILLMISVALAMVNTEERLHIFVKAIALAVGFYGLKGGVFVVLSGGVAAIEGPEDTYLSANNALGMAMAMNAPLLFYLARVETNKWLRWLMRAMFLLSYPAVAGTFSRGAWLGLAVVTGLLVIKAKSVKIKMAAALVLVLAVAVVVPSITSEQLQSRFATFTNLDDDGSAQSRFWNWTFCWKVGASNPLLGAGFDYYSRAAYLTFYPEFLEQYPDKVWSCHNMWLTIWGELGLAGSIVWLLLLISSFMSLQRLKRHGRMFHVPPWVPAYSEMIQMAFIAFMVCGTFVDNAYFEMYYCLLAVVIVLKERMRDLREREMTQQLGVSSRDSISPSANPVFAR